MSATPSAPRSRAELLSALRAEVDALNEGCRGRVRDKQPKEAEAWCFEHFEKIAPLYEELFPRFGGEPSKILGRQGYLYGALRGANDPEGIQGVMIATLQSFVRDGHNSVHGTIANSAAAHNYKVIVPAVSKQMDTALEQVTDEGVLAHHVFASVARALEAFRRTSVLSQLRFSDGRRPESSEWLDQQCQQAAKNLASWVQQQLSVWPNQRGPLQSWKEEVETVLTAHHNNAAQIAERWSRDWAQSQVLANKLMTFPSSEHKLQPSTRDRRPHLSPAHHVAD